MEEKKLKVMAVQIESAISDKKSNFEKVKEIVSNNFIVGTDIIVLPEVWTTGWYCPSFRENAENLESGETIEFLKELARKYNVYVIGGSYITVNENGEYKNTCPVISPTGELIASYSKMHLFSYYGCDEGSYVKNGEYPVMVEIKGVKIGLSICYDIRFPEIYRAYRKADADLLINMAAWPKNRKIHWESLTCARAVENQSYFVALTQSGVLKNGEFNLGESRIIDYEGNTMAEITEGDGVIFAEMEFSKMYNFRNKCTVLNDIHEKYTVE